MAINRSRGELAIGIWYWQSRRMVWPNPKVVPMLWNRLQIIWIKFPIVHINKEINATASIFYKCKFVPRVHQQWMTPSWFIIHSCVMSINWWEAWMDTCQDLPKQQYIVLIKNLVDLFPVTRNWQFLSEKTSQHCCASNPFTKIIRIDSFMLVRISAS